MILIEHSAQWEPIEGRAQWILIEHCAQQILIKHRLKGFSLSTVLKEMAAAAGVNRDGRTDDAAPCSKKWTQLQG